MRGGIASSHATGCYCVVTCNLLGGLRIHRCWYCFRSSGPRRWNGRGSLFVRRSFGTTATNRQAANKDGQHGQKLVHQNAPFKNLENPDKQIIGPMLKNQQLVHHSFHSTSAMPSRRHYWGRPYWRRARSLFLMIEWIRPQNQT